MRANAPTSSVDQREVKVLRSVSKQPSREVITGCVDVLRGDDADEELSNLLAEKLKAGDVEPSKPAVPVDVVGRRWQFVDGPP
jgi:hypothetical protein